MRSALFSKDNQLQDFLAFLNKHEDHKVYGISTCDRIEVYFENKTVEDIRENVFTALSMQSLIKPKDLKKISYEYQGLIAIKHFFRVVSSLDSIIVGEPQILGQVRAGQRLAKVNTSTNTFLDRIFQHGYFTAKRVRTETEISEGPTSLAAAAIRVARDINGDLSKCNGIIFGIEEIAVFLASQFEKAGAKKFLYSEYNEGTVSNELDPKTPHNISTKTNMIVNADIILVCSHPSNFILGEKLIKSAIKVRKHRPIFIIDLGIPSAVEPAVELINEAFVYNLGDLEKLAVEGMEKRRSEMAAAETIIMEELDAFSNKFSEPDIGSFAKEIREALEGELLYILEQKPSLNAKEASYLLLNKFLHQPITALRELSIQNKLDSDTEILIRKLLIPKRGTGGEAGEL